MADTFTTDLGFNHDNVPVRQGNEILFGVDDPGFVGPTIILLTSNDENGRVQASIPIIGKHFLSCKCCWDCQP